MPRPRQSTTQTNYTSNNCIQRNNPKTNYSSKENNTKENKDNNNNEEATYF